jgi:hypothetical protein
VSRDLRYRVEQNAVAICLVFSAICFGIGHLLRSIDKAVTLGGAK